MKPGELVTVRLPLRLCYERNIGPIEVCRVVSVADDSVELEYLHHTDPGPRVLFTAPRVAAPAGPGVVAPPEGIAVGARLGDLVILRVYEDGRLNLVNPSCGTRELGVAAPTSPEAGVKPKKVPKKSKAGE